MRNKSAQQAAKWKNWYCHFKERSSNSKASREIDVVRDVELRAANFDFSQHQKTCHMICGFDDR